MDSGRPGGGVRVASEKAFCAIRIASHIGAASRDLGTKCIPGLQNMTPPKRSREWAPPAKHEKTF